MRKRKTNFYLIFFMWYAIDTYKKNAKKGWKTFRNETVYKLKNVYL